MRKNGTHPLLLLCFYFNFSKGSHQPKISLPWSLCSWFFSVCTCVCLQHWTTTWDVTTVTVLINITFKAFQMISLITCYCDNQYVDIVKLVFKSYINVLWCQLVITRSKQLMTSQSTWNHGMKLAGETERHKQTQISTSCDFHRVKLGIIQRHDGLYIEADTWPCGFWERSRWKWNLRKQTHSSFYDNLF